MLNLAKTYGPRRPRPASARRPRGGIADRPAPLRRGRHLLRGLQLLRVRDAGGHLAAVAAEGARRARWTFWAACWPAAAPACAACGRPPLPVGRLPPPAGPRQRPSRPSRAPPGGLARRLAGLASGAGGLRSRAPGLGLRPVRRSLGRGLRALLGGRRLHALLHRGFGDPTGDVVVLGGVPAGARASWVPGLPMAAGLLGDDGHSASIRHTVTHPAASLPTSAAPPPTAPPPTGISRGSGRSRVTAATIRRRDDQPPGGQRPRGAAPRASRGTPGRRRDAHRGERAGVR